MKRRNFIGTAIAAGLTGTNPSSALAAATLSKFKSTGFKVLPDKIAGMSLEELRDEYHDLIFNQYLPFWEKGGYDKENGGFMCELYDDGSVQNDGKDIWYQGRGIWVYAFLYNNFGKDQRFLDIAKKSRDFMVKNMYTGDGMWRDTVNRQGKVTESVGQGSGKAIYGAMFAAVGLIELYKATGNKEDMELAKASIWKSSNRYENPDYEGVTVRDFPKKGLRTQGHSFMMVWAITQLLSFHQDNELDGLVREHANHIMNDFWNPEYGIANEHLQHDYSRIPGIETHMNPGHSLETMWMVMFEALRVRNGTTFYIAASRIRRIIEMSWDYIFDGFCDTGYDVFGTKDHPPGPVYDIKTMWAHTEVLISCLTTLEYTGNVWAKEWFERAWAYTMKTMITDHGVWRQAVDRLGKNKKRAGITIYRKGNFHQPRALMYNLLTLNRMIKNNGKLTPFPL